MEEHSPSKSINISGGQLSNIQIGGKAGRDLTVNQSQQIGDSAAEELTLAEITGLLDQLKGLLQASSLSEGDKAKAIRSVETVRDEVQADEPDKAFAIQNLQRATSVLMGAGETVEAGTSLWQKVKPILEAIGPWFGVAASFLI